MELTISGKDKNQLKKVEDLAREMGLKVSRKRNEPANKDKAIDGETLYKLMEEMASSGGLESIKDPVEWQREVRKDRPLPGRES